MTYSRCRTSVGVGFKNSALLAQAAASGFDALLTMDSGVPYQQNVASLPLPPSSF